MAETVASIVEAHRSGQASPRETIAARYDRIRRHGDEAIFIALKDETAALAEAEALEKSDARDLPLYGVPVAVKDNIDAVGFDTTAACPAFAYRPTRDATVVAKLKAAGAIIVGKTNLDQFATGLVGVRSPYGIPRNAFDPALVPGGSSSGSAVAVAAGLVPLALGTDTAGSGRVPAGLNNIVGLKPSLGLLSCAGVVPACRSLDCVSIFSLTVDDAVAALSTMAGSDAADPFSRDMPVGPLGALAPGLRIGVPRAADRLFFGDKRAEAAFAHGVALSKGIGGTLVEIDLTPFLETARLLYEGPWVAERYAAVGAFIEAHPNDIHPITRKIIASGATPSAADTFRAMYRLAELRAKANVALAAVDVMMVPTAPAAYTLAELEADPIELNSRLGTYTNFVNLLDLCGLAVPCTISPDGPPFGVTFLARAGEDALLANVGRAFHTLTALPLGAIKALQPPLPARLTTLRPGEIALAVVGAHLSGMPLNGDLRAHGARFVEKTKTHDAYRLFALGGAPARPGLLRTEKDGAAVEVEIWALPADGFGRFVTSVPPPLSIGTLTLAGGRDVKGFLVEALATANARDISAYGGWRSFVAQEIAAAV